MRRPPGDKEHRRVTDIAAGSISPQKIYGVPVGLMFFEGAPRLIKSGVTIPILQTGDPSRIVSKPIQVFWRGNSSVGLHTRTTPVASKLKNSFGLVTFCSTAS